MFLPNWTYKICAFYCIKLYLNKYYRYIFKKRKDLFLAHDTVWGLRVLYSTESFKDPSSLHLCCHLLKPQTFTVDPLHPSANGEREVKRVSREVSGVRTERGTHNFYLHAIDQTGCPGPHRCQQMKNIVCGVLKREQKTKILMIPLISVTYFVHLWISSCFLRFCKVHFCIITWRENRSDKCLQLSECNFQVNVQFYPSGNMI